MPEIISTDPHLAERECCECGKEIIVTYGPIRKAVDQVTGAPKMVLDQDLNITREGWICDECGQEHYKNGDAAWGGDGSFLMMPSYYE